MIKKTLSLCLALSLAMNGAGIAWSAYNLSENEIKIAKNFIEDGRAMYQQGDFDQAILSFSQVLLIDPHNSEAQYYLSEINRNSNIRLKNKIHLVQYEDLYANLNSLKARIDYFEKMRNMLGRKLVGRGYSSEALAQEMIEIKNEALKTYAAKDKRVNQSTSNKNPLAVLNSALEYEKDQLSLKSYYLKKQYDSMRQLDESETVSSNQYIQSKYKTYKHTNRFYTPSGRRIIHQNPYMEDINMKDFDIASNDVGQLKRQIALIRREMNNLQGTIDEKQTRIGDLKEELVNSTLKVVEKDNSLKELDDTVTRQNNKIIDYSSRLELSKRIIQDKQSTIGKIQEAFEDVKDDAIAYEQNLNKLLLAKGEMINQQSIRLDDLKDKLALLEDKIQSDRHLNAKKVNQYKEHILSLLGQVEKKDAELSENEKRLEVYKMRAEKQEYKLALKDKEIKGIQRQLKQLKKITSRLEEDKDFIQKKIYEKNKALKAMQRKHQKEAFQLENQVARHKEQLKGLKAALKSTVTDLGETQEDLFIKMSVLAKCKEEKSQMAEMMKKYEKDLERQSRLLADVENKLADSRQTVKDNQADITRLEDTLNNTGQKLDKALEEKDRLARTSVDKKIYESKRQEAANLKDELAKVKADLEERARAYQELNDRSVSKREFNKRRRRIARLRKELMNMEGLLDQAISEKEMVEGTLVDPKMLALKDKEIEDLKQKLSAAQLSLRNEIETKNELAYKLKLLEDELDAKVTLVEKQDNEIRSLQRLFDQAQDEMQRIKGEQGQKIVQGADGDAISKKLRAKDQKIAVLKRELGRLERLFNQTKFEVKRQKMEMAALKRSFEEKPLSDVQVAQTLPAQEPADGVDKIINDLISLNTEIMRLQGTFDKKSLMDNQQLSLESVLGVLAQSQRISKLMEFKANKYIMIQGQKNNQLKGILEIYKDKLYSTNISLKQSEATVSTLRDQIAFAQKQLFEKDKLLKKTQNDLLTLEEELTSMKTKIEALKNAQTPEPTAQ
jgi:hypothetical protein